MAAFIALLKSLPEILALIQILQKAAKEAGIEHDLTKDVGTIHSAFASGDVSKLNGMFKRTTPT
jgi:uncharacterized protein YihD (DUF1040 family)